jgi:hypothetical protein
LILFAQAKHILPENSCDCFENSLLHGCIAIISLFSGADRG